MIYRLFSLTLFLCMLAGLSACTVVQPANEEEMDMIAPSLERVVTTPETLDLSEPQSPSSGVPVSDYEQFLADDGREPVTVESFLQEKYDWEGGQTSLYLQDEYGAYFVYRLPCTLEEYESLLSGQKLRVTGYKTEFSGEPELTDATFSILEGTFRAEPVEVPDTLDVDSLYQYVNRSITLHGFIVEPMFDGESAFFYGWDNSENAEAGADLYFTAAGSGFSCTAVVKTQLRDPESEVYRTAQRLQLYDRVQLTGILTWYNGPQLLVTAISVLS